MPNASIAFGIDIACQFSQSSVYYRAMVDILLLMKHNEVLSVLLVTCLLHVCFFALLHVLDVTSCHVAYWGLITTSDWETANAKD